MASQTGATHPRWYTQWAPLPSLPPLQQATRRSIEKAAAKYKGQFKDGEKEGQGTYTALNGNVYTGQYKSGRCDGQGTFTWGGEANGAIYQGQFKDDLFEGHGTLTTANGNVYDGQFKKHLRHGRGVERKADGTVVHDGEWRDGKPVR